MRPVCLALYLVLAVALEFKLDLELSFFEHAFLLRFSQKRKDGVLPAVGHVLLLPKLDRKVKI